MDPDVLAQTYWSLHVQDQRAWTQELDIRPSNTRFQWLKYDLILGSSDFIQCSFSPMVRIIRMCDHLICMHVYLAFGMYNNKYVKGLFFDWCE